MEFGAIWSSWIGLGVATLLVLTIVAFFAVKWMNLQGDKKMLGNLVVLFLAISTVIAAVGGATVSGEIDDSGSDVVNATWAASGSESESHVLTVSTTKFVHQVTYNTTSDAFASNTQWADYNFTVMRTDSNAAWSYCRIAVENIGEYASPTTSLTYPVLAKQTNGLYYATFNNGGGSGNMQITLPKGESRNGYATFNYTLNSGCIDSMAHVGVGQSTSFTVTLYDANGSVIQSWDIDVVISTIRT